MTAEPTFGVVIPYYRGEKFWAELVRSLALQERRLDQAAVVLDGGDQSLPDGDLPAIATEVKVLRHDVNRGVAEARNTGLGALSTDYVFFMDQDDFWYGGRVAAFSAAARRQRPECLTSWYDMVDAAGKVLRPVHVGKWVGGPHAAARLNRQFRQSIHALAINALCCRRESAPPFDPFYATSDDYLFIFELLSRAPVTLIRRATGARRFHGGNESLSRAHPLSRIRAVGAVARKYPISRPARRRGLAHLLTTMAIECLGTGRQRRAAHFFRRALKIRPLTLKAAGGLAACRLFRDPAGLLGRYGRRLPGTGAAISITGASGRGEEGP